MNLLFRLASIVFLLAAIVSGVWGVKESHWLYITLFGVFSTFSTFLFILTHPESQQEH
ncbi:MAG: hypothetical protein ABEK50_15405 [bacterium]